MAGGTKFLGNLTGKGKFRSNGGWPVVNWDRRLFDCACAVPRHCRSLGRPHIDIFANICYGLEPS